MGQVAHHNSWGFTLFTELETKHHVSTHMAGMTNHRDWRQVCYEPAVGLGRTSRVGLVLLLWYIRFTVHQLSR